MSNTAIVAVVMAMVLILAAVNAQATNNGLSEKQIRNLIKKEVAKIPRGPRGPAGPAGPEGAQGPAGKDGVPILSAHVFGTGRVDDSAPGGITQENVRRATEINLRDGRVAIVYCFSGLPPVVGGQVTLDGLLSFGAGLTPYIAITEDPDCNPEVTIAGTSQTGNEAAGFFVLLY